METLLKLISTLKPSMVIFEKEHIVLNTDFGKVFLPNETQWQDFYITKSAYKDLRNGHIPENAKTKFDNTVEQNNLDYYKSKLNKEKENVLYAYEIEEAMNGFIECNETDKKNLQQVSVEVENNVIQYISTDAYVLMLKKQKCLWNKSFFAKLPYGVIKTVKGLIETAPNKYSKITRVTVGAEYALFKDVYMFFDEEKFPDYKNIIPNTPIVAELLICQQNIPNYKQGQIAFGTNNKVWFTDNAGSETLLENAKHFTKTSDGVSYAAFSIPILKEMLRESKSLWLKVKVFSGRNVFYIETSNPNVVFYAAHSIISDVETKLEITKVSNEK